jgi:DNA-binding MarR family transcriptional regulator
MTEPSDVAARLQNLATRLLRQARLLDNGASLTSAQYAALSTLNSQPDLTLTELARLEVVSHPTMSRILSALVKQGLVERRSDIADRRSPRLSLTPIGRDAYLVVYARRLALIESMLTQLKPETVTDLMQALEKLPQMSRT